MHSYSTKEVDVGGLLHLFDVSGLNNLFIVEEYPYRLFRRIQLLTNECHIMSAKLATCLSSWGIINTHPAWMLVPL